MSDDGIVRATILKKEFQVSVRQLELLGEFVIDEFAKEQPTEPEWGEGVDSAALAGLDALFFAIPPRFPLQFLLKWVQQQINPSLPLPVLERALIRLGLQPEE